MHNQPLNRQIESLIHILLENPYANEIINGKPFDISTPWYLGAGCISQSVWNYLTGNKPEDGIKDYDLIYFDANNISSEIEQQEQLRVRSLFSSIPVDIDVVNEARVHTWFEKDIGVKMVPLLSCEDAINKWPTTATCVGINKIDNKFNVYAPYGLNDVFGMVVRPNKSLITRECYEQKVTKWTTLWPDLTIIPWGDLKPI